MNYDLSHLTQDTRRVYGPIQDDEALLLFALVRCLGAENVVEVGGQDGYSARNFLAAGAAVWTIDIAVVPKVSSGHTVIVANAANVDISALPAFDLVFYDAHDIEAQKSFHDRARACGLIHDETTVVVHDTGLHRERFCDWSVAAGDRWKHQPAEREFVEWLASKGWQRIHVHADDDTEPRHGLTVLQAPRNLS